MEVILGFDERIAVIDARLRDINRERNVFLNRAADLFDIQHSDERAELLIERERALDERRASWREE